MRVWSGRVKSSRGDGLDLQSSRGRIGGEDWAESLSSKTFLFVVRGDLVVEGIYGST